MPGSEQDVHHTTRPTVGACEHLKLANNWMKTHYDRLANCAGYHEHDRVWLYCPTPNLTAGPIKGSHPYK
jgi:hypothetical protein